MANTRETKRSSSSNVKPVRKWKRAQQYMVFAFQDSPDYQIKLVPKRRRPHAGQNIGGTLTSKVQGVWETYTQFPIDAGVQPIFPITYKGFLQDLAAFVKASSTDPCLNGSVFQSNLVFLHLNVLQGYHPISVFSESSEAFLDFLKGVHLMILIIAFDELRTDFKSPIDQCNPVHARERLRNIERICFLLRKLVLPEYSIHSLFCIMFLCAQEWLTLGLNVPLLFYHFWR
ncbi:PREDICTED: uncharacterized protein LOC104159875 [Cariama cristata]|uniref:uncharacterized protein LOC104159875 n=1 Tax=Cariama cristata TaxID=54380 RepID=UPI0005205EBC|nr:PREDICTED: uncharacterized protein LOC104159875 [Cariama cristata]